ncbi:hypothetical protein G6F59_018216 [Rhizopus arrhizus]|nr:hypothetical protein G6F59_018216 [Rhizopus arrhizus]
MRRWQRAGQLLRPQWRLRRLRLPQPRRHPAQPAGACRAARPLRDRHGRPPADRRCRLFPPHRGQAPQRQRVRRHQQHPRRAGAGVRAVAEDARPVRTAPGQPPDRILRAGPDELR